MRYCITSLVCLVLFGLAGCSTFQKAYSHQENEMREYHDDWKNVGEEGRAELPREKETDKLTPLLQSPKARAIEKNMGFD